MNKEIIISQISTVDYIARFRDVVKFIEFCKECKNYKSVWSCPPFDAGCCRGAHNLEEFSVATIIGVKINLDEEMRQKAKNEEERNILIRDILSKVRREFDRELLALEQKITPSQLYYAGSCRLCAPGECTRVEGQACRYPEKMRTTLEAVGFDMGRTTSELLGVEMKWCEGLLLPPYFTLVYGLLTNCDVEERVKEILLEFTK